MKQLKVFGLVALLFVLVSGNAFALNGPAVNAQHGVVYGMFVSDHGLMLGGEIGLNSQLAIIGNIGGPMDRLGIKYEMNPNMALTAGVANTAGFVGLNGAFGFDRNVQGLYEVGLIASRNIGMYYDFGVKVNVDSHLDIRGGLIGTVYNYNYPHLQLGLGYRF